MDSHKNFTLAGVKRQYRPAKAGPHQYVIEHIKRMTKYNLTGNKLTEFPQREILIY